MLVDPEETAVELVAGAGKVLVEIAADDDRAAGLNQRLVVVVGAAMPILLVCPPVPGGL